MILVALFLVPLVGGLLAWLARDRHALFSRWISLAALAIDLVLALRLWGRDAGEGGWIALASWEWIPRLGIGLRLGVDGLSLILVSLTLFLGILSVAASWTEISRRVGFFHFNLLWTLAGVIGVFLALDLFLFYFFWELMLVPMAFLIGIWGHENRRYAAIKFFLFTQASGLLMLVSILGLVVVHWRRTEVLTFDYRALLGTTAGADQLWLLLGFVVAFAVKLPAVPFHTWLPDAHTEAPTAGSVILAGLLLKTGGYGLLRFAVPLFPEAARQIAPWAMAIGAVGIVYGAVLAFAQTDLKRLVAYTSVSHLGFVLLGIFASGALALQGVTLQMVCHGLSTGALFILAGVLQERLGTRDLRQMGGFWAVAPRMGALAMLFAMASLGLPGLGNFVAELLVLLGSFAASVSITAVATAALVLATVYSLRIVQRVFHGPRPQIERPTWSDLSARETLTLAAMAVALVWLGLFPQPVIDIAAPALAALELP
ncbi:MAG TPA: NADH-quinone oxidoreductase subunit M [Thermoanaerobaculia bacterium]|nr:NADH-quinone oxidoreductase subunit M [Thermoanaerobaculia bacterium]